MMAVEKIGGKEVCDDAVVSDLDEGENIRVPGATNTVSPSTAVLIAAKLKAWSPGTLSKVLRAWGTQQIPRATDGIYSHFSEDSTGM